MDMEDKPNDHERSTDDTTRGRRGFLRSVGAAATGAAGLGAVASRNADALIIYPKRVNVRMLGTVGSYATVRTTITGKETGRHPNLEPNDRVGDFGEAQELHLVPGGIDSFKMSEDQQLRIVHVETDGRVVVEEDANPPERGSFKWGVRNPKDRRPTTVQSRGRGEKYYSLYMSRDGVTGNALTNEANDYWGGRHARGYLWGNNIDRGETRGQMKSAYFDLSDSHSGASVEVTRYD